MRKHVGILALLGVLFVALAFPVHWAAKINNAGGLQQRDGIAKDMNPSFDLPAPTSPSLLAEVKRHNQSSSVSLRERLMGSISSCGDDNGQGRSGGCKSIRIYCPVVQGKGGYANRPTQPPSVIPPEDSTPNKAAVEAYDGLNGIAGATIKLSLDAEQYFLDCQTDYWKVGLQKAIECQKSRRIGRHQIEKQKAQMKRENGDLGWRNKDAAAAFRAEREAEWQERMDSEWQLSDLRYQWLADWQSFTPDNTLKLDQAAEDCQTFVTTKPDEWYFCEVDMTKLTKNDENRRFNKYRSVPEGEINDKINEEKENDRERIKPLDEATAREVAECVPLVTCNHISSKCKEANSEKEKGCNKCFNKTKGSICGKDADNQKCIKGWKKVHNKEEFQAVENQAQAFCEYAIRQPIPQSMKIKALQQRYGHIWNKDPNDPNDKCVKELGDCDNAETVYMVGICVRPQALKGVHWLN